ncbi:hypothetical protein NQ317_010074 [Molorchus minor]|uniref:DDE Tnp4 domain-containing protein n=1 Tax=Molorchus minor TaxID=1323400 RepID=A0ABQ9J2R7_9CUCU|nr:hypothetical protein NQ317_010074 [Molorchus minor]
MGNKTHPIKVILKSSEDAKTILKNREMIKVPIGDFNLDYLIAKMNLLKFTNCYFLSLQQQRNNRASIYERYVARIRTLCCPYTDALLSVYGRCCLSIENAFNYLKAVYTVTFSSLIFQQRELRYISIIKVQIWHRIAGMNLLRFTSKFSILNYKWLLSYRCRKKQELEYIAMFQHFKCKK